MTPDTPTPTAAQALAETRAWVDRAVIGLNLCPFAKAPQVKGLVRYVVSTASDPAALLSDLITELERLAESKADKLETTLLVHPRVLTDFADYNDFLAIAEDTVAELDLDGVLQVASFHPQYQFDGTTPDDVTNATNRSPWPTLHLIREASIDAAVEASAHYPVGTMYLRFDVTAWDEIGTTDTATVIPGNLSDYDVFVQSKAPNRKIPRGTKVIINREKDTPDDPTWEQTT